MMKAADTRGRTVLMNAGTSDDRAVMEAALHLAKLCLPQNEVWCICAFVAHS